MSSSDDKPQKKRAVHGKRSPIFCSTPVLVQGARRLSSISISAVETNSSSAPRNSRESRGQTVRKAPRKKRKRKQGSKARRQKRRKVAIDSDSEWETKLEQSVHEEAISQRVSTQKAASASESVLFKDAYGSPERVREAPHFFNDDRFESPVFRPIRRELGSPEKIGFKENEGILAVEDLPTCQARVDDIDDVDEEADNKEESTLRKTSTVVTYLGTRKKKWHKIAENIVECHVPLEKVSYHVATANLLWDNFVKDNREKISKSVDRPASSEHQESQSDETGECLDSRENQSSRKTVFEKWGLKKPDWREINVTRGWRSKSSKKWVRVEDVYEFPGREDLEFQKRDRRGRKMTLNEYLRKCRMEKENLRHCSLDSRSPVASRNTRGSRRPRNDVGTIQKEARPYKNLEYEFERSKVESTTRSKRRMIVKNKPTIRAIEPIPDTHTEYVQKVLELCEKHY